MKILITSLFILNVIFSSYAQDKPTNYTDSTGNLYWRKSTPLYLFVSDKPDGDKKRLKSKATEKYADPLYLDTEGINYIRTRNAVDSETKKVMVDTEVLFEVYADGLAPKSEINYENVSKHRTSEALYYQNGLSIVLSAKDQMSGVRKLSYAINGEAFKPYQKSLAFQKQGEYTLRVNSEDNVGNVEKIQSVNFIIDNQPPYSEINVNGITEKQVVSTGSKMYLIAYDSLSGVKSVNFKFDDQKYRTYNGKELPFSTLDEGEHVVTFYSVDQVGNNEKEETFNFFLDKSAPLMVADVLGDRFIVDDNIYFSGRTKLKLTAVDNKVGVKEIMFSVDTEGFNKYDQPFYLPSVSGVHIIRYYSVDNLNNSTADSKKSHYLSKGGFEEFKHSVSKFYVDLTGPVIDHKIENYSFVREDTLYIGPYSKIRITGHDPESQLKELSYAVNDQVGETKYSEPFTLKEEGYTTLHYFGYDNVNNRNISETTFYLDATKPEVFAKFNTGSTRIKNGLPVYPRTTGIFLSATDKTSGIKQLYYTLGKESESTYKGLIANMRKGKHTLSVRAIDHLNNEATKVFEFYIQ